MAKEIKAKAPVAAPAKPEVPAKSEADVAANLGAAIAKGITDANEKDKMVVTVDDSVTPRFSLVRNAETGEVFTRENETGLLSALQLKSLEEKQADLQSLEVEEV